MLASQKAAHSVAHQGSSDRTTWDAGPGSEVYGAVTTENGGLAHHPSRKLFIRQIARVVMQASTPSTGESTYEVGRWKEYLYGEYGYTVLSIVAKTALAWQVFAGTLR